MAFIRAEIDPGEKHSLVMLSGLVHNKARFEDGVARFSLLNGDGNFFIKVQGRSRIRQCLAFEPGDKIIVIGYMGSFVSRKCGSHHTFVQGVAILATEAVWADLWEEAGLPVLLRSLYSELLHQEQDLDGRPTP